MATKVRTASAATAFVIPDDLGKKIRAEVKKEMASRSLLREHFVIVARAAVEGKVTRMEVGRALAATLKLKNFKTADPIIQNLWQNVARAEGVMTKKAHYDNPPAHKSTPDAPDPTAPAKELDGPARTAQARGGHTADIKSLTPADVCAHYCRQAKVDDIAKAITRELDVDRIEHIIDALSDIRDIMLGEKAA